MTPFEKMITQGCFPLWGGMRDLAAALITLVKAELPLDQWNKWVVYDPTCGSCATAASFAYFGMFPHVSDIAKRSTITAEAVFGKTPVSARFIQHLLCMDHDLPDGVAPATDLANGFIHPKACEVFDKLYWSAERGESSERAGWYCKYLAIRYVMEMKPAAHFMKLPVTDLTTLTYASPMWAKVADKVLNPGSVIKKLDQKIDPLVRALGATCPGRVIETGSAFDLVPRRRLTASTLISMNGPTLGPNIFEQSNRVLDSLIENKAVKPTKNNRSALTFWTDMATLILSRAETGNLVIAVYNNGELTYDHLSNTVAPYGKIVQEFYVPKGKIGLALIRIAKNEA